MSHKPVLLNEVLQLLDPHPGDFMIDGTLDGGNHAAAIMKKIVPGGALLGVDWDEKMIGKSSLLTGGTAQKNVTLVHGNYADLPEILKQKKFPKADGLLLDLGFSSEQLEGSGMGFSFAEGSKDEPLTMTYSDDQIPVSQILREIDEQDLANVIYELGGERFSRRIAKAIKDRERRRAIVTTGELADTIRGALSKGYERGRIDPATRTFQALRIYANHELKNLKKILDELSEVLKPGGRAVIISFHSLEDKIVKQSFQKMAKEGSVNLLTKKPIAATREEILQNPRSRSAKLRAVQILNIA